MKSSAGGRYFDLSTLLTLGLAALLLIGLPGGCGDNGENGDVSDADVVAEPTSPPMMEIVDPEPGDINVEAPEENEAEEEQEPPDEAEGEEDPPQEGDPSADTYVVQQGDTLYGIAMQFGISVEELMQANGMADADALQVGQVLEIPR